MNAARELAAEISHVYNEVKQIIPDVIDRIGPATPTWIKLEAGQSATIRDFILHKYAQAQHGTALDQSAIRTRALACPLSFDITSNPRALDIDHFHPSKDFIGKLNALEAENNQILLAEIRTELLTTLTENEVNALIPKSEAAVLKVTGLKNIYYNYPNNLWPVSGPLNSSKGDRTSLDFSAATTLNTLRHFLKEEQFTLLVMQLKKVCAIVDPAFDVADVGTQLNLLSAAISRKFEEQLDRQPSKAYILPFIIQYHASSINPGYYDSELNFYQQTTLGQTAAQYSASLAAFVVQGIELARSCVQNLQQSPAMFHANFFIMQSMSETAARRYDSSASNDPPTPKMGSDTDEEFTIVISAAENMAKKARENRRTKKASQEEATLSTQGKRGSDALQAEEDEAEVIQSPQRATIYHSSPNGVKRAKNNVSVDEAQSSHTDLPEDQRQHGSSSAPKHQHSPH